MENNRQIQQLRGRVYRLQRLATRMFSAGRFQDRYQLGKMDAFKEVNDTIKELFGSPLTLLDVVKKL